MPVRIETSGRRDDVVAAATMARKAAAEVVFKAYTMGGSELEASGAEEEEEEEEEYEDQDTEMEDVSPPITRRRYMLTGEFGLAVSTCSFFFLSAFFLFALFRAANFCSI